MIKTILFISRPRFWIYLLGPFLVGFVAAAGISDAVVSPVFWYGFFFFLLPANVFLYGVNDFFDGDTDIHNEKKGIKESLMRASDRAFYMRVSLISFLFALPFFLFLDTQSTLLLAVFFLLAFFYSAPPLRLKAKPFLDFISNILYILPGVIIYQQITKETVPLILLIAAGCWAGAMHLYSAIPDIKADRKAGLITTAVLLEKKNSLVLCMILWGVTAFIVSGISPVLSLAWIYPLIVAAVYAGYMSLKKTYWYFPWINLLLGFLLFIYVALV
ncbi:prenyltransferase [Candidatus Roizmanbacteria bacterium]|nr:MAG: prenyltransferase [Candidatus Roizmanbacteria bacterium]